MRYIATITLATSLAVAQNVNLGEIVVTATKSEQSIKETTSNITIITKEELEDKHITTVAEALKSASGVIVAQSGGFGQQTSIFLRGFDSDSTIVMINGVKINNPTLIGGQADIGNLVISDIERIEIIKGPQSGIYGASAVAGVINIITKSASKKCSTNIDVLYGSYETKKTQLSFSKKFGKLSAYLGYSYLDTNGFTAQADINEDIDSYEDDSHKNETLNFNLNYDFTTNDKIKFQYTKIDTTTEYDQSLISQEGHTLTQDDEILNLSYLHKYTNNSYSKLYFNKATFSKKDPTGWTTEFKGENKEYGIDNKYTYSNIELLFGANKQISKDIINNNELEATGIYLTSNLKHSNTIFTATLRRDLYSDFDDKTTGKIGIKHLFNNGLTASANYATAYRVPSLFEYSLNSNLEPESTKGFDISLEYKNFFITYFDNKIDDEILYSPTIWNYYNSSNESKIRGIEIGYKGSITDNLLLSANYTKYSAKDEQDYQLARRPEYSVNLDLDYYGFKNTHINLNAQYIGKRVEYIWGTHTVLANTGNIFVANLNADYKFNDKVTAYVKINNITDKKYQDVYGYATSGRAVYVGLNAKF